MSVGAAQILAHAAGELDLCPACGHAGHFGAITLDIGRGLRCPKCGAEQLALEDIRMPAQQRHR